MVRGLAPLRSDRLVGYSVLGDARKDLVVTSPPFLDSDREEQIRGVAESTAGIYGDLQGIAGSIGLTATVGNRRSARNFLGTPF
jgi:hypothetical protein